MHSLSLAMLIIELSDYGHKEGVVRSCPGLSVGLIRGHRDVQGAWPRLELVPRSTGQEHVQFFFKPCVYMAEDLSDPQLVNHKDVYMKPMKWEPLRVRGSGDSYCAIGTMICFLTSERRRWCHELGCRIHLHSRQMWPGACPGRELR